MVNSTKIKKNEIIKFAEEIIHKSSIPMSPDQIKSKYKLEFPFTVKRAIRYKMNISCPHMVTGKVGEIITFNRFSKDGSYVYAEFCNCFKWHDITDGLTVISNSERFVLI